MDKMEEGNTYAETIRTEEPPAHNHILALLTAGRSIGVVDVPFSAPKLVSLLALHMDDERLITAHEKAVQQTIDYLEGRSKRKTVFCGTISQVKEVFREKG